MATSQHTSHKASTRRRRLVRNPIGNDYWGLLDLERLAWHLRRSETRDARHDRSPQIVECALINRATRLEKRVCRSCTAIVVHEQEAGTRPTRRSDWGRSRQGPARALRFSPRLGPNRARCKAPPGARADPTRRRRLRTRWPHRFGTAGPTVRRAAATVSAVATTDDGERAHAPVEPTPAGPPERPGA